ncbi:hypothetical protein BKA56DRAFT_610266 [Ilyonectria sp. MPI-CAGE-AT-0026]|nr:hypothetical protein BKA56DRAFT_610266 [Ilyonectria sp. MPI-CAGE-AT-0026]
MAALRLSIPLGNDDNNRQEFVLRIHSIGRWRQLLNVRRLTRVTNAREQARTPPKPAQQYRRLALVDRHQRMNEEQDQMSEPESLELCGGPSASESSDVSNTSRWSHSTGSLDDEEQSDCQDDSGMARLDPKFEDRDILNNREEALLFLGGHKESIPDRNYTGAHTKAFERIFRKEEEERHKRELEHAHSDLHSDSPGVTNLPQTPSRRLPTSGWPLLRAIILSSLYKESVRDFPLAFDKQVYLLKLQEFKDGRTMVVDARNLNACSNAELVKRMTEVEQRGWRDILWVSDPKDGLPRELMTNRSAKKLDWGHKSMI